MSIAQPPVNMPYLDGDHVTREWIAWLTAVTDAVEDAPNPQTGDFTAGDSYRYEVDASGGDVTVTLPSVVGLNTKGYLIVKTDSSANKVILDPDGTETILGDTTLLIGNQFDAADIFPSVSDLAWYLE